MSSKKRRPAKSTRAQPPAKRQAAAQRPGSARPRPAGGRPATQPGSFYTPGASPLRQSVERASAPVLILLRQAPRLVIMLTPLAIFLLGAFLPVPYAYIALALFFLLTFWLAYLSWTTVDARAKAIRVLMFALVLALVVLRAVRS